MEPVEVAKALELEKLRVTRREIDACCPLHHDRHPSFRMNRKTGQWICYAGCGAGNIPTLLKRLGRTDLLSDSGQRAVYTRTTARTSGSIADLLEQMRWCDWMLRQGYQRADVLQDLQDRFEISRSTAYEIVGWLTGRRWLWRDQRGVLRGRRYAFCLRYLRDHSSEHRVAVKAEKSYWAERTRLMSSYMVCTSMQEVMYRLRSRRGRPVPIRELVEERMASMYIPRPPPGIARWSPFEIDILTAEVLERQRRGFGLLSSWEIEFVSGCETTDHFSVSSHESERALASLAA